MVIFNFFSMVAYAILNFEKFKISAAIFVRRANMRQRAKFRTVPTILRYSHFSIFQDGRSSTIFDFQNLKCKLPVRLNACRGAKFRAH